MKKTGIPFLGLVLPFLGVLAAAEDFPKPYSPPCVEREDVFEFTEKPAVRAVGEDRYEITFAVKGYCDVTVAIMGPEQDLTGGGHGVVARHLASGVLGANAPAPFQKNSLKQTIYWDGKDDLGEYHKTPEKLACRVMLGLKPVFDKRLGGTSPKNLPGRVIGIAVAQDGAYVVSQGDPGWGNARLRKFDREGKYVQTLCPPPANLPESKLAGMSYVEYEPGRRALHGPLLDDSVAVGARYLVPLDLEVRNCQPVVVGNRFVFASGGNVPFSPGSFLHYIYTDGSTDLAGIKGRVLVKARVGHLTIRMAASPDGKTLYFSRIQSSPDSQEREPFAAVYSRSLDGEDAAKLFAGEPGKPGSDDRHFGATQGIDCDPEGRVYVADSVNNRIQVFSPERKLLKTIPLDRPNLICIHKKTGAIYVLHTARVEGRSVSRITKLVSFADPKEEFHVDGIEGLMALDSWSAKPRFWLGGGVRTAGDRPTYYSVRIFEEEGGKLRLIGDFAAEAEKEEGRLAWGGIGQLSGSKSVCDPVREKFYYSPWGGRFDLVTGVYQRGIRFPGPADDIAFDKKGHLHGHENPGRGNANVWRADPGRAAPYVDMWGVHKDIIAYPECPYDYGEEGPGGLRGVVRTKCQPGACTFQMGLGVNMQGDLAVESQIYYVPKMEDEGMALAMAGAKAQTASGRWCEENFDLDKLLKETEMRGEHLYAIRREPGIPLVGSTIFTWDRLGEAKNQYPVVIGQKMEGVQIDEAGAVYFSTRHARRVGKSLFLEGKGGVFGEQKRSSPPVWVCGKGRPEKLKVLLNKALVPLDEKPKRPFDLGDPDAWVEGADWLYAGYGPSVPGGCVCPQSRFHLDWYKRSYMPESYRHGFAILDTNGNLILHVGRYANFDSAPGGKDGCKPGETDIGILNSRYLGGTDNYLAFEDWGERLVVLKLNYQAEETVPVRMK